MLRATRPTAVNLFWAIDAMLQPPSQNAPPLGRDVAARFARALAAHEDVLMCLKIGEHGAPLLPAGRRAHALQRRRAGDGRLRHRARRHPHRAQAEARRSHVFADETRPFLQGARLTAWELHKSGIDVTLITDNMAGALMQRGEIQSVIVGADRIAANGDTANKIGTYGLALLARAHDIPFFVAAPLSTVDLKTPTGAADPDRGARRARGHPRRRHAARARRHQGAQSRLRRHAGRADQGDHHQPGRRRSAVRQVARRARREDAVSRYD